MVPSQYGSKLEDQLISLVKGCNHDEDGCSPAVPYCSVLPSDIMQLVEKVKNASIPCGAGGARRSMKRARAPSGRHPLSSGRAGALAGPRHDVLRRLVVDSDVWDGAGSRLGRSDSSRGESALHRSAGLRMKVEVCEHASHARAQATGG